MAEQVARFVAALRELDLKKNPSVSETLDWARALLVLSATELGEQQVRETLNLLLKYEGDIEVAEQKVGGILEKQA